MLYKHHTIDTILRRVVIGLNALHSGRDPESNKELAGSCRFALTEIKGDWLWHKEVFRFKSMWTQMAHVCYRCDACADVNNSSHVWSSTSESPTWVEHDLVQFLVREIGNTASPCPLILCKGFHPALLMICSMHVLNLGLAYDCNGAAMMALINCSYFGATDLSLEERFANAYDDFRNFLRSEKISCSQPPFRPSMVMKKDGQCAFTCKAYNGRCVAEWLCACLADAAQRPEMLSQDERLPLLSSLMLLACSASVF
ncbi:unnamed protein product [Effrenium voratum]|nr:unnamed protein product [Effrenium voratum]